MLEELKIETKNSLSRRDFLVKAGALTAGMAVAGGYLGSSINNAEALGLAAFQPIPYKKLDVEAVRAYGFEGYKKLGGCCIGAAYGLLHVLQSQTNHDVRWDAIDPSWFKFGAGGINSWGTLCGALNGSLYVMSLALGFNASYGNPVDGTSTNPFIGINTLGHELISWYCKAELPSPILLRGTQPVKYDVGVTKVTEKCFIPNADVAKPATLTPAESTAWDSRLAAAQVKTVAGSPLCHASVSIWCHTSGKTVGGTDKSDRCGRLTGDVAAKAAIMLNQVLAGRYRATAKNTAATNVCMGCHNHTAVDADKDLAGNLIYKKPSAPNGAKLDEQGKMPCVSCHTDEAAHNSMMDGNTDCDVCHTY